MKNIIYFCFLVFPAFVVCQKTSAELKRTAPEKILTMYQMLKDVHELFYLNDIEYWAAAGTLLGAVRHQGIIPWDVDLDIFISQNDEKKLTDLSDFFNELSYKLHKKRDFVYTLYSNIVPSCHLDIIFVYEENDKIFYSCKLLQKRFRRGNSPLYFTSGELYPLQEVHFGEFMTKIPNNPYPYLQCAYGIDCLTHAHAQRMKVLLLEMDMVPALPTGPLVNNINIESK